jgi:hypothetical protein
MSLARARCLIKKFINLSPLITEEVEEEDPLCCRKLFPLGVGGEKPGAPFMLRNEKFHH